MKFWIMKKSVCSIGIIYDFENKNFFDNNIFRISIHISPEHKRSNVSVKTRKSDTYQEIVREGVRFKAEMSGKNTSLTDKYYFDSTWMHFSSPPYDFFEELANNPDMMRTFKDHALSHNEYYQDQDALQNSILEPLSVLAKIDEAVAEVLECMKEEIKQGAVNESVRKQLYQEAEEQYQNGRGQSDNGQYNDGISCFEATLALLGQIESNNLQYTDEDYRLLAKCNHNIGYCHVQIYNENDDAGTTLQLAAKVIPYYENADKYRRLIVSKNEEDILHMEENMKGLDAHRKGTFGKVTRLPVFMGSIASRRRPEEGTEFYDLLAETPPSPRRPGT